MNKKPTDDQCDLVVNECIKTFGAFEKATKTLISIMESMNKQIYQEPKRCLDDTHQIDRFIMKALDDTGHIQDHAFAIRYVADKEKKQE